MPYIVSTNGHWIVPCQLPNTLFVSNLELSHVVVPLYHCVVVELVISRDPTDLELLAWDIFRPSPAFSLCGQVCKILD